MACVARGTLVEVVDQEHHTVVLREIETLRAGDVLAGVRSGIVCHVYEQHVPDDWPLYSYMGLHADAAQWVRLPSGTWERISRVGVASAAPCCTIYGVIVAGGDVLRGGGVDCRAHRSVSA